MVTTFYPPYSFGGDAVFVRSLSRALAARGHEVEVIHCADSYAALGGRTPTEEASSPGITVHTLRSRFGLLSPVATQQLGSPVFKARAIRRILESKSFDVTHFHNVSLVGGPGVLSYGKGIKLYTMHEHWLLCPMHVLFRDNRQPCDAPRCVPCAVHHRRPPQLWRYTSKLRDAVGHVDAFIAPTEFTRRLHLASGLPMRIVTLPPFADATAAPVRSAAATMGRPFFLYAGRLERSKGVHTLLPVFRDYPAADLIVAGDGSLAAELRQQAGQQANIHFVGRLSPTALIELYSSAVAVLVPSLAMEVFPMVILEAFAAATPVIARRHGPLVEIVADSGGGLTYATSAELLQALHRLQTDRSTRDDLGRAGQEAWLREWTGDVHLSRYMAMIERLRARQAA